MNELDFINELDTLLLNSYNLERFKSLFTNRYKRIFKIRYKHIKEKNREAKSC
jgi:hypothetical protein